MRSISLFITKTIVRILLLAICLSGCGIQPPPNVAPQAPNTVSLDPQNWDIFYSNNMPAHPSADPAGVWSFEFPSTSNGGHVNYIQTPFNATTVLHNAIITFRVESEMPVYQVTDDTDRPPATIHMFFEQKNDNLINADGRWWAASSKYELGLQDNQTIRFIIPLTPDMWGDVYGNHDSNSFYAALNNIGWIGITCGGQFFYGHGVSLDSGTSKFVLINFEVN